MWRHTHLHTQESHKKTKPEVIIHTQWTCMVKKMPWQHDETKSLQDVIEFVSCWPSTAGCGGLSLRVVMSPVRRDGGMCPLVLSALRLQTVQTYAGPVYAAAWVSMSLYVHQPCCVQKALNSSVSLTPVALLLFPPSLLHSCLGQVHGVDGDNPPPLFFDWVCHSLSVFHLGLIVFLWAHLPYFHNRRWQNCSINSCLPWGHSGWWLHSLILLGSPLVDFSHLYPYHEPGRAEPCRRQHWAGHCILS